ncbi:MAG: hypothetical protein P4M08_01360 [Oligoflexia bacterium]|nr:hypothetical protein [Oligoflexia bacterium]
MAQPNLKQRIMLVSRDLQKPDFTRHISAIMKRADESKCDTISFALFTFTESPTWEKFFAHTRHVQRVLVEVGEMEKHSGQLIIQLWQRDQKEPRLMTRQFARSSEPSSRKLSLIQQFKKRVTGKLMTLICGELSIINIARPSQAVKDPFGFRKLLDRSKVQVILSPAHTWMVRHEMNKKRAALSKRNRLLVSVWNRDSKRKADSKLPWIAYRNGRKKVIREIESPISSRPDIRLGLISNE